PQGHAQGFVTFLRGGVLRLHQPQQVDVQSLFICTVCRGQVVTRSNHAAIFGCPFNRRGTCFTAALGATRKNPEVGSNVQLPVHGTTGNHLTVITQKNSSSTRLRGRRHQSQPNCASQQSTTTFF